MFFDLISSVIFEKRLSFVFIGMQFLSAVTAGASCEPVMQRNEKTTEALKGHISFFFLNGTLFLLRLLIYRVRIFELDFRVGFSS